MLVSPSWSLREAAGPRPPIELLRWKNLHVLPYIRRRLVFAHLAAATLEQASFDWLAVDLPYLLNRSELLEVAHSFFPRAFSLIIRWDNQRHLVLPFVPNDAGYLATFAARRKLVAYEGVDDENLVFYPEGAIFAPDLPFEDDYCVFSEGLEGYFAPPWSRLDALWKTVPPLQRAYTQARAAVVAARLGRSLSSGKQVLFVCEYRLWWAVKKVLEGEWAERPVPVTRKEADMAGAFVAEDPFLLWAMGFLDDFPAVNLKFCQAVQSGDTLAFDKLDSLNRMLTDFIYRLGPVATNTPSIRRLLTFQRYLRNRLISSHRIVPLPARHLLEAAKSCFGKEFARELAATLLEYPDNADEVQGNGQGFFRLGPDGSLIRGEPFEVPDILNALDYFGNRSFAGNGHPWECEISGREQWADLVRQRLTRTEARYLAVGNSGMTWALKEDYLLHQSACAYVREVLASEARRARTRRSWGSMGDGLHWKATIAAKARGERAIYVKRLCNKLRFVRIDEYTPIAFLFSHDVEGCAARLTHDANIAQRNINLGNDSFPFDRFPPPDLVYSLLRMVKEGEGYLDGHFQKELNTAMALLYTRSSMGVERYEAITRKPRRYQCRLHPSADTELKGFPLKERLVAWAIKYAEHAVMVVAYQGWRLSERLKRFARERHVQVITLPLSILSPGLIQRLQISYHISTALKKSPDQERILRRFIA